MSALRGFVRWTNAASYVGLQHGFRAALSTGAVKETGALRILRTQFGMSAPQLLRLQHRHPMLERCCEDQVSSILRFLQNDVRITKATDLSCVASQSPEIFFADVAENLAPTFAALCEVLPQVAASAIVRDCPEVLLRRPSDLRVIGKIFDNMGISLAKVAKRTPRVLLKESANLKQVFDFLLDDTVGPAMTKQQAAHVASSFPMLLIGTRNPMRQLAPLVKFLKEELGVDPASDGCHAFYAWPDSLDAVKPTAHFLIENCGFKLADLRAEVSLLGYSLEQRIQPRSMYAHHLSAPRPSLRTLTAVDDLQFCHIVGSTLEAYREFAKGLKRDGRRGRQKSAQTDPRCTQHAVH